MPDTFYLDARGRIVRNSPTPGVPDSLAEALVVSYTLTAAEIAQIMALPATDPVRIAYVTRAEIKKLPGVYLYSELPEANLFPFATEADTSDYGPVYTDGASWITKGTAPQGPQNDTDANLRNRATHTGSDVWRTNERTINTDATSAYTLQAADGVNTLVKMNFAGVNRLVLPATSVIPDNNPPIPVMQYGAGPTHFEAASGVLLRTPLSAQIDRRYGTVYVKPIGANEWGLFGDLATAGGPIYSVAPTITGTGIVGATMTGADGTWPTDGTHTRQWLRDGAPIVGATNTTYVVQAADVGKVMTYLVTVTLNDQAVSIGSNGITGVAVLAVPANTVAPSISGANIVGATITLNVGSWSGSPTGYKIQRKRNGVDVGSLVNQAGTTLTYVIDPVDAGANITYSVIAYNGSGDGAAALTSAFPVAAAAATPPAVVEFPQITGTPLTGQVLACSTGLWTGINLTFAFQWYRTFAGNTAAIVGATSSTYTPIEGSVVDQAYQQGDSGALVSCEVSATNTAGTTKQMSSGVLVKSGLPPGVVDFVGTLPSGYQLAAAEGGTVAAGGEVAYGAGTTWRIMAAAPPGTFCDTSVFGDPIPGTTKQCRLLVAGAPVIVEAPLWQSKSTATSISGASATNAKPTGLAVGDLMLRLVGHKNATLDVTTPAGWTLVGGVTSSTGASGMRLKVFTKVADAADVAAANFTTNFTGAVPHNVELFRVTGQRATNPVESCVFGFGPSGPTCTAPSVNTQSVNTLALAAGLSDGGGGVGWGAAPGGWTARSLQNAGKPANMASYSRTFSENGAVGTTLIVGDSTAADQWATVMMVIAANGAGSVAPAPPPPSPAPPPPAPPPPAPAPPGGGTPFDNGVPATGSVIFQGSIKVSDSLVGMHWAEFAGDAPATSYHNINENIRINAFRAYGAFPLEWYRTEPAANGVYVWTHWDIAQAFWARNGFSYVTLVLHGPPDGYRIRPKGGFGDWSMQLTNSQSGLRNYLTAICNRYPIIKAVEVANEVTYGNAIASGQTQAFWQGTEEELMTLCNWVLDWGAFYRANHRPILIQSPSCAGEPAHADTMQGFFTRYPRTAEFDIFTAHGYFRDAGNLHLPAQSGVAKLKAYIDSRFGVGVKQFRDGEHGFASPISNITPGKIYNMYVRGILMGLSGIDIFNWGIDGMTAGDANTGVNYLEGGVWKQNASVKAEYTDAALLAGTTITKVMSGPGGKWRVEGLR